MDTEFTISSGTTDFTATIDRDARRVKIIAQETSDPVDRDGVTDWPTAETPSYDAVRLAIEAHYGVWIEPIDFEWSAAELPGECVLTARFTEEQPTHRIVFTETSGVQHVDLVMLHDEGGAYTHDEWDGEQSASWGVSDGHWYCEGQATPGGQSGSVEVEDL